MTKVICNCCGKEISSVAFHMDEIMPYGSEHDGDLFTLDLCANCMDKLVETIRPLCKIDPLTEF